MFERIFVDRMLVLRTGRCYCQHNTAGDNCERCMSGYYGSPTYGTADDCQPCPCPVGSNCVQLLDGQVACLDCPSGYTGIYEDAASTSRAVLLFGKALFTLTLS